MNLLKSLRSVFVLFTLGAFLFQTTVADDIPNPSDAKYVERFRTAEKLEIRISDALKRQHSRFSDYTIDDPKVIQMVADELHKCLADSKNLREGKLATGSSVVIFIHEKGSDKPAHGITLFSNSAFAVLHNDVAYFDNCPREMFSKLLCKEL